VIDESTHLIWSNEHRGWRRAGGLGYSVHVEEAGRFTGQRALEECGRALVDWRPGTPYPDMPIAERHVMLILGRSELSNTSPMAAPAASDLADI
jgi:hypothetical protein